MHNQTIKHSIGEKKFDQRIELIISMMDDKNYGHTMKDLTAEMKPQLQADESSEVLFKLPDVTSGFSGGFQSFFRPIHSHKICSSCSSQQRIFTLNSSLCKNNENDNNNINNSNNNDINSQLQAYSSHESQIELIDDTSNRNITRNFISNNTNSHYLIESVEHCYKNSEGGHSDYNGTKKRCSIHGFVEAPRFTCKLQHQFNGNNFNNNNPDSVFDISGNERIYNNGEETNNVDDAERIENVGGNDSQHVNTYPMRRACRSSCDALTKCHSNTSESFKSGATLCRFCCSSFRQQFMRQQNSSHFIMSNEPQIVIPQQTQLYQEKQPIYKTSKIDARKPLKSVFRWKSNVSDNHSTVKPFFRFIFKQRQKSQPIQQSHFKISPMHFEEERHRNKKNMKSSNLFKSLKRSNKPEKFIAESSCVQTFPIFNRKNKEIENKTLKKSLSQSNTFVTTTSLNVMNISRDDINNMSDCNLQKGNNVQVELQRLKKHFQISSFFVIFFVIFFCSELSINLWLFLLLPITILIFTVILILSSRLQMFFTNCLKVFMSKQGKRLWLYSFILLLSTGPFLNILTKTMEIYIISSDVQINSSGSFNFSQPFKLSANDALEKQSISEISFHPLGQTAEDLLQSLQTGLSEMEKRFDSLTSQLNNGKIQVFGAQKVAFLFCYLISFII